MRVAPLSVRKRRGFRAGQTKLIVQVQTLDQARQAVDADVDAIVAQGTEAGSHGGTRATLPFVPPVVDIAQNIPVIAAGGIAGGRGLAAALALGAEGVLCGTGFFASDESLVSHNAKQMALGGCLCGAISFEVVNTFEKLLLRNCDQCRQITGSGFASNLFMAIEGFDWLEGAGDIVSYQVPERDISKAFCRVCGSGVPWGNGDGTKMIVPAGSLSEPAKVAERFRVFTSERPAWALDLDHVPAHARFP